jgi:hypothetical protein
MYHFYRPEHSSFLDAQHVKGIRNLRKILMVCITYGEEIFASYGGHEPLSTTTSTVKEDQRDSSSIAHHLNLGSIHVVAPLNLSKVPPSSPSSSIQVNTTSPT